MWLPSSSVEYWEWHLSKVYKNKYVYTCNLDKYYKNRANKYKG